jgi:hypothetical protein
MSGIDSIAFAHPSLLDQIVADAAHATLNRALAGLSAAKAKGDPAAISAAQWYLAGASSTALTSAAHVQSDSELNIIV